MKRRGWAILLIAVAMVLLGCLGESRPVILVGMMAFGWTGYLKRVAPQIRLDIGAIATALICLTAAGFLSHSFCSWLWREMKRPSAARWRGRWTVAGLTIVVLMFAAGTATVGLVHQTTWLLTAPEPVFRFGNARIHRLRCGSNMKHIHTALLIHAQDHGGRMPMGLEELFATADLNPECLICPESSDDKATGATTQAVMAQARTPGHLSYIYLVPGREGVGADDVVLIEPLRNHAGEGINVLYADGRVEWLSGPPATELLQNARQPATRPH